MFSQRVDGAMPTIELTDGPGTLLNPNAKLIWWKIQILAHSFYPAVDATALRSKWTNKVLRGFAKDWTGRICLLQPAGRVYQRWIALHGHSLGQDEVADLKPNDNRDLRIAIEVLLQCTLKGFSKAQASAQIARELVEQGGANSLESAEWTIKRAWRKYNPGCHFAAAELLVGQSECGQTRIDQNQSAINSVSLAEKLRDSGENTVPTHGSVPILDPAKTWKVPNAFPLSAINIVDCDGEIQFNTCLTPSRGSGRAWT